MGSPSWGELEGLLYEYLGRLESTLPPPQLQQLQEAAWSECPLAGPPQRPSELSVLAQYLTDMGYHQHMGSPALPLVTSTPSLPPVPGTPGSRQRRSQEGAAPAQEEMPPDLGLHCQPPGEQDLDTSGDIVWESEEEESCGPRRKVPWLLRSRDPAPAPRHRRTSLRRVPHKAFNW
nr:TERF1-interacting nuclear factor 2 isoform X3 [Chrysemys picta bellii]